jgi:cytochrome P460
MSKTVIAALLVMLGFAFSAPALAGGGLPGADAAAVWNYITKTSPYKNWGSWPDYQGPQRARSPHGPYNKVYVNGLGLSSKKAPAKYGTMEVKVAQSKDGKVKNITVQYKVKGYNQEAGDWFWAMYSPEGKVGKAGKIKGCIRCHGAMADNDFIMVHNFK